MTEATFASDVLKRQGFAARLAKLITVLAESEVVPGGRVIAVDSPWGSGKTWLAQRLPTYLTDEAKIGRCTYVNAFQFDFHHDPFAVLASAVLSSCAEHNNETATTLRTAAGAVLKATLPAVGKGLVKLGAKSIGVDVDVIADAISDAAGKTAETAVDHLLSSFEETTTSTTAFRAKLSDLATATGGPLIIIVDELDRCKPDFALNLLERVKHLFDVEGVVFVLFAHTPALHSAIRQTYGDEIDAAGYLRKFISITLPLPTTDSANGDRRQQSEFARRFLQFQYGATKKIETKREFMDALSHFAPVFHATFRDLQNAVLIADLFPNVASNWPPETAYLLLLRLCDPQAYVRLARQDEDSLALELARLRPVSDRDFENIAQFRNMFLYKQNPGAYQKRYEDPGVSRRMNSPQECEEFMRWFVRAEAMLRIEHLEL
jgi:hypothetical protein